MTHKIEFPAIIFDNFAFRIINQIKELRETTSAALKNGLYSNIIIVDSKGDAFQVLGAKKIRGIGFLWGYDIFLNQNVLVDLDFYPIVKELPLVDVKNTVKQKLKKEKDFWESGGNIKGIFDMINTSDSFKTLIISLGQVINKEYHQGDATK